MPLWLWLSTVTEAVAAAAAAAVLQCVVASMVDDVTGEPLERRRDDTPAALADRLASFHAHSAAILAHYRDGNNVRCCCWACCCCCCCCS